MRTIFLRLLLETGPPFLSAHPSKGVACLQSNGSIPSFLSYSKILNSGAASEIDPATIRPADKRCISCCGSYPGAGGVLKKVLCGGEDPPRGRSNPLHTIFDRKGTSFVCLCIPFNQCRGTAFKILINHKTRTFSPLFHSFKINLSALFGPFYVPK